MCGIAGIFLNASSEKRESLITRALSSLSRRGPDSSGVWSDSESGITFGHTRLAILDLSPAGHQPMHSRSGRFVISFNGEVYNFRELAADLELTGVSFQGGSDTEVLLAAFEEWGISGALERFNGMFAIALWDRHERDLYLCRDRAGIKPLYYGWQNGSFSFASEPDAIKSVFSEKPKIHRQSLALYMRHNYIPMPYTIYEGIFKLLPGTFLKLSLDNLESPLNEFSAFPEECELAPVTYWSSRRGKRDRQDLSDDEMLDECEKLIKSSVSYRMIADVPLGAFLSGGIDSSLVVSVMQQLSDRPVKTFSIGFHEQDYDEANYAKQVADHLGTDHTELYVTPQGAQDVIPLLPEMFQEPFSDSSQIPTYLVSKLAREQVTVSLSGDGGDELFCGYARYEWARSIWKCLRLCPLKGRGVFSALMKSISPGKWDAVFSCLWPVLPQSLKSFHDHGEKLHRLADVLSARSAVELYAMVNTHWNGYHGEPVLRSSPIRNYINDFWPESATHTIQLLSEVDMLSYLPDDILTKVDRTSMFCSLEARVPLLDHRLIEFALSLPVSFKMKNGIPKYPLKKLLSRYIPDELINRPKRGFSVPVGEWLRGPLRDWAEELLSEHSLGQHDFFHVPLIRQHWQAHLSGERNYQYLLWDVLCFQSWYRKYAAGVSNSIIR